MPLVPINFFHANTRATISDLLAVLHTGARSTSALCSIRRASAMSLRAGGVSSISATHDSQPHP